MLPAWQTWQCAVSSCASTPIPHFFIPAQTAWRKPRYTMSSSCASTPVCSPPHPPHSFVLAQTAWRAPQCIVFSRASTPVRPPTPHTPSYLRKRLGGHHAARACAGEHHAAAAAGDVRAARADVAVAEVALRNSHHKQARRRTGRHRLNQCHLVRLVDLQRLGHTYGRGVECGRGCPVWVRLKDLQHLGPACGEMWCVREVMGCG
eukprot:362331-Chlamydomonas_euryale.AAC.1